MHLSEEVMFFKKTCLQMVVVGMQLEERCKVFAIAEHIASERIVSSVNDR